MDKNSIKRFITKAILLVMLLQVLQLDVSFWVLYAPKAFAEDGIITEEINLLASKNPALVKTHAEEKQEKIAELQDKIEGEIENTWYGKAKTEEDKIKKEQLDMLGQVAEDGGEDLSKEEKEQVNGLLELEEVTTFIEKDGEKKEVNPALVKNESGGLVTAATEYETEIGGKSGEGISIGIKDEEGEIEANNEFTDSGQAGMTNMEDDGAISVKFTQLGVNDVEAINENNKALYKGIYPYVDFLVTTLPEGVKEDLILKSPVNYSSTGETALGYQGDTDWAFEYALELNGLTVEESDNGLSFLNEDGEEVMFTPAPVMYDRLGQESYKAHFEIITSDQLLITNEETEIEEEVETWTGELLLGTGSLVTDTGALVEEQELTVEEILEKQEKTEDDIDVTDVCVNPEEESETEGELDPSTPSDESDSAQDDDSAVQESEDGEFKGVGGGWEG